MKYKIGQKVRVKKNTHSCAGMVLEIDRVDKYESKYHTKQTPGDIDTQWWWHEVSLEPVEKTFDTIEVDDVIVCKSGYKSKVIDVLPNSFLRSVLNEFEITGEWIKKDQAEKEGWTIEGATESDLTEVSIEDIAKWKGVEASKIRVKE